MNNNEQDMMLICHQVIGDRVVEHIRGTHMVNKDNHIQMIQIGIRIKNKGKPPTGTTRILERATILGTLGIMRTKKHGRSVQMTGLETGARKSGRKNIRNGSIIENKMRKGIKETIIQMMSIRRTKAAVVGVAHKVHQLLNK